jgi:indoleamine 2,3-dioxygenase
MPGKHRDYVLALAADPKSLRRLVQKTPELRVPYNSAIVALKRLRDVHLRIACVYIVSMSRTVPNMACPVAEGVQQFKPMESVRGTGGNPIVALLKSGRDATARSAVRV